MKFFNSSKKWRFASSSITKYILAALLSLAGVQGVLAQYYVAGDGTADNGWACGENWNPSGCEMSQSGNVYVYDSPVLAAGTYLFRITNGSSNTTWGWSEVYSSRCTAIVADDGSTDHNVKITLNESSKVKIIFNPNAAAGQKITVYAGITPLYIRGDVNGWGNPSNWQGVSTDGINYTWKGTLLPTGNEGKTNLGGAFKIATAVYANVSGNDTWSWDDNFDFGGEGSGTTIQISDTGITTATLKAKTETGGNGNLSLSGNLQYPGAVYATMITFNISTKELVIYTKQIKPDEYSYVVEWAEPVYDSAAGTVTVSATVSTAENAGFTLADATFEAQVNVEGMASSTRTKLNQNNNSISHTIQGVQAGSTVNYSLQIVTGGDSKIVLPSDVANINPQDYKVPEPVQPDVTDLYIFGVDNWQSPAEDWKYTSVSEGGNVYTWDWTAAKTIATNTHFKIGAKNAANTGIDDNNNYGPSGSDVTLDFNGVQSIVQTVVNSKESKAFYVSEETKISKIVFDKSDLTVTFYPPEETQDPVYAATITADASASQQVSLASALTETAAGTDLATATCVFQYKAADAGDETYADMSETASVIYSGEGATRTATLRQSMAAGSYVFRAVWTYSEAEVASAVTGTVAIGDAGVTYPVIPMAEHFSVEWTPVYNPADGTVTFTAQISATEDAGFVMGQITGLVAYIIVNGNSTQATVEYVAGSTENTATATVTYQNASIDDVLEYSMSLTTGSNGIVSGVSGIEIAGGSYTVIEPEAQNSTLILRGEMNSWAYDSIDDKYVGKTYDGGTTVFWDWSESPVEFAFSSGDGSTFKIDDTTDGKWGEGQWGYKADNDFWIVQDLISSDGTVTITGLENHANASSLLFDKAICPVTVSRMELNTAMRTLKIDCEITVPQKDIWFRSEIVEGGWGDGISDPIGSGVSPKYKGQTTDGKIYIWDWSGSNAVTVDSGVEFKFGEYTGSSSWGNSGYAPNGQASVTSADFGKEISVQVAAGNFSAGEKITITKITLDTETLKLKLEGEKFTERFPVTVNVVNGENGSVVTDPSGITNMAVGETVTVTATPNEGYTVVFEASNGCQMTDGSADNIKVFEITEANPVITVTFQVQCQTVETGFTISGQFNKGVTDGNGLYEGTAVESGGDDPKDGYWSDGARFVQLTANSVPANYFKWECVGYKIDDNTFETENIPMINWKGDNTTSARAELSLPGTYTFVCNAKCNLGDDWTQSDTLTITAPVPAMGFDGVGIVGSSWDHTSAGREGEGLMTRQNGSLVWKSRSLKVNGFTDADEFVIIQQYKRYGCTPNNGWNGWNECQAVIGNDWGNKINGSNLNFSYVKWKNDAKGLNFLPVNAGSWVAGADGTDLQLVVTMTGHDSYTVELAEYKNIIATATTEPDDVLWGTVSMAAPDGTIIPSGSNVADYVGQQVTLTATPASGYKVASWTINGKVTVSDRTTISPTLSGKGLNVVVTFERDCYSGVVYDLTGGGIICADRGSTELSLNTLNNVTYQLYRDGEAYGEAVPGNGEAAKWTISEVGIYTAKAYDSRFVEECQEQAIDMNGSAEVTTVTAPKITVNPGENVHLTVLQARSFTADVPVNWSITEVTGTGKYCEGDGYMISSQTDTSLVAKFLCIGTAKITATMKAPNENCMAEVTVHQNGAETEVCASEPGDMQ